MSVFFSPSKITLEISLEREISLNSEIEQLYIISSSSKILGDLKNLSIFCIYFASMFRQHHKNISFFFIYNYQLFTVSDVSQRNYFGY